jgi:ABC-2 type transport system ATP-binding protein/lipopolysaccharide transport system ATP-binding protein
MTVIEQRQPKQAEAERHNSRIVIRVEGVSVRYRVPHERISTFKEYAIRALQRRVTYDEFFALHDVSLDVKASEVFGVIGRNGAGKSTLLRVISRVMRPTNGRVWRQGRVAPLLELGGGFHPELTGRENIFLNGALLGHSRTEMARRFDEIVEFAELSEFIDTPLRSYSSGMSARLGFAVATSVQPDVLIVDEVLSVGDERFQQKRSARIDRFRSDGATILLVSHNATLVQSLCDRAVWLDKGRVKVVGPAAEVVSSYQNQ